MSLDISTLTKSFSKAPLPAFVAVLILAVIWLAIENKTLSQRIVTVNDSANQQIAQILTQCANEKDALRQEQIQFINASLLRLQQLDDQLRAVKKRKQ